MHYFIERRKTVGTFYIRRILWFSDSRGAPCSNTLNWLLAAAAHLWHWRMGLILKKSITNTTYGGKTVTTRQLTTIVYYKQSLEKKNGAILLNLVKLQEFSRKFTGMWSVFKVSYITIIASITLIKHKTTNYFSQQFFLMTKQFLNSIQKK